MDLGRNCNARGKMKVFATSFEISTMSGMCRNSPRISGVQEDEFVALKRTLIWAYSVGLKSSPLVIQMNERIPLCRCFNRCHEKQRNIFSQRIACGLDIPLSRLPLPLDVIHGECKRRATRVWEQ